MTFLQRFLEGENWKACGCHKLPLAASNQRLLAHLVTPQGQKFLTRRRHALLVSFFLLPDQGHDTVCHTVGVPLNEATKLERSICALLCIFQCNQVLLQGQNTFSQPPHENKHLGRETHSTPRPPDVLCLGHQAALCLCATCRLPPRGLPFLPSGPSFRSWLSCVGPLGTPGQPRVSPWLRDICVEICCEVCLLTSQVGQCLRRALRRPRALAHGRCSVSVTE